MATELIVPAEPTISTAPPVEPTRVLIELSDYELWLTEMIGRKLYQIAQAAGNQNAYGLTATPAQSLALNIQGSITEFVIAKYYGLTWTGEPKGRNPDVGKLQVKSTNLSTGQLLVRKNANPVDPYILVLTHAAPKFVIAGWMLAEEAMRRFPLTDLGNGRDRNLHAVKQEYLYRPWDIPKEYLQQDNGSRRIGPAP